MKRMPIPTLVLAVALAVLLPLEQAHCMWMGLQKGSTPVSAAKASVHPCCARAAAQAAGRARQQGADTPCNCPQLPSVVLPGLVKVAPAHTSTLTFVVPTLATPGAPVSCVTETVLAPIVGSPPLPATRGAHGLRAPPVSA